MIENSELSRHVDDVLRAVGNKITKEKIEKELIDYLNKKVPMDIAKQSVVKKYGGDICELRAGVQKKIDELKSGEKNADILCRVVSVNERKVTVDNQEKKIFYGVVGDQTGTKPFTAWDDFNLNKNDVIMIHNAYTTEYQGVVKINLGKGASVTKESPDMVPSIEYKGKLNECRVADFREGLRNISVKVKIVSIQERKINVKGTEKKIYSGVLGDETGKARFTSWHDFGLKENDRIKITGGYIKTNRGLPTLNFDEKATVEKIEEEINVTDRKTSISELTKTGGGFGVVVDGIILDVKKGSGLIFRCPECKRSLQKGVCVIHGKVEGVSDLRTKAVADDGTGALSILFGREITEKILGKSIEDCEKTAQEKMSTETITDELTDKLLTKNLEIRGYTLKDDYGITLIASDAVLLKKNAKEEAEKMLEELT
ncbi:MAG: hypothetical protein QMC80_01425 [Thermoplasmatales archaeon]|nr:hypothetical protein [Thermoplasmatales archaeon]